MSDEPLTTEEAQHLLVELQAAKQAMHDAEAEVRSYQNLLVDILKQERSTKVRLERVTGGGDDKRVVVTTGSLVEPVTVVIDEAKLKRAVGAATFRKVCREVMDKDKLEKAVQDGVIDIAVVAECSDEVAKTPYIRITSK